MGCTPHKHTRTHTHILFPLYCLCKSPFSRRGYFPRFFCFNCACRAFKNILFPSTLNFDFSDYSYSTESRPVAQLLPFMAHCYHLATPSTLFSFAFCNFCSEMENVARMDATEKKIVFSLVKLECHQDLKRKMSVHLSSTSSVFLSKNGGKISTSVAEAEKVEKNLHIRICSCVY